MDLLRLKSKLKYTLFNYFQVYSFFLHEENFEWIYEIKCYLILYFWFVISNNYHGTNTYFYLIKRIQIIINQTRVKYIE